MQQLILVMHMLAAIAIIVLVLLQHGRGADAGAAFGSGASNTMFGSIGTLPFLMKVTAVCVALFFTTSITLSYMGTRSVKQASILDIPSTPTTAPVEKGISFTPTQNMGQSKKDD